MSAAARSRRCCSAATCLRTLPRCSMRRPSRRRPPPTSAPPNAPPAARAPASDVGRWAARGQSCEQIYVTLKILLCLMSRHRPSQESYWSLP